MLTPSKRFAAWLTAALLAAAAAVGTGTGCSEGPALPATGLLPGTTPNAPYTGPCDSTEERACSTTLGEHAGVLTCYHGSQRCVDGFWSACGDGQVTHQAAPNADSAPSTRTQALSTPVACETNPCDPYCQVFLEQPDPNVIAEGGTGFTWTGGTLTGSPQTAINTGLRQPCRTGSDCQFNTYCKDVTTSQSCEHNKCQTGGPLTSSCDPCVAEVCAVDSSCCSGPCKPGEIASADGTRCYFVQREGSTWPVARSRCLGRGDGWDLTSLSNLSEAQYVANLITTDDAWIGLNDLSSPNVWEWANGEAATFFNWAPNEPSNAAGEDCVRITAAATFLDRVCETYELHSVCEGPAAAASSCVHDICITGPPLKNTCDPCVAQICQSRPSCCNNNWDSTCTSLVNSVCGRSCPCKPDERLGPSGGRCYFHDKTLRSWASARTNCQSRGTGWDLAKIESAEENAFLNNFRTTADPWIGLSDQATEGTFVWFDGTTPQYTHWRAGEPNQQGEEDCVEIWSDGGWNDTTCSLTRHSHCEGPTLAPVQNRWSQTCVGLVESVCDVTCGSGTPPRVDGTCTPWAPGETEEGCQNVDLGVGPPCVGTIPVCNHGTVEAPAGIQLIHLPAGSGQYGRAIPDPSGAVTCTTSAPIPAGECISVTDCTGLTGSREIMVNPPGAGQVTECSTRDNWAIYSDGVSCSEPLCTTLSATNRPLNLYVDVLLNNSMKLDFDGVRPGLSNFVKDPASAGLGIAMNFPPQPRYSTRGCDDNVSSGCSVTSCEQLFIPLGTLTADPGPADSQEQAIVNVLSRIANNDFGGDYSLRVFLAGLLNAAARGQQAAPNEEHAVVLIVDRPGTACSSTTDAALALAADAFNSYGIRTYVINMESWAQDVLAPVATAGGGQAFAAFSGDTATKTQEVESALRTIRDRGNIACSYELTTSNADPYNTVVTTTDAAGVTTELTRRTGAAACGSGYYFDDPDTPTNITLCPDTCTALRATTGARVDIEVPCATIYAQTVYSQVYESQCNVGSQVQWGFFAYDSETLDDSSITFLVRTAATVDDLAQETLIPLATAAATSETGAVCSMAGPAPCPVDLFSALGGLPTARQPALELVVTLNPSSNSRRTPSLNDWQVTYSCPPAE